MPVDADRRRPDRRILLAACVAVVVVCSVPLLAVATDASLGSLTQDVSAVGGLPYHAGFLSQLGMLVWAAGVAISSFAGVVAGASGDPSPRARLLAPAAAVTAVLMLDDLFLFHESAIPENTPVPETVVLAVLAAMGVGLLWWGRDVVRSAPTGVVVAVVCFGVSLGVDASDVVVGEAALLLEDGAKFVGIAAWSSWLVSLSADVLRAGPVRTRVQRSSSPVGRR